MVQFAGVVYFKNFVKKYWKEDRVGLEERQALKNAVVVSLVSMRGNLQMQISEALAIIAEDEFPEKWPHLIPMVLSRCFQELVSKLTGDDFGVNLGILQSMHSIFKRWRPQERSDILFLEIKKVLDEFAPQFLELFKMTDKLIDSSSGDRKALEVLFQNLLLLVKIFYSFNCQDLPEFFEAHQDAFMGLFLKYLNYANPLLDSNSDEGSISDKVKSSICENISLYASKYEEDFTRLSEFVDVIWNLLCGLGVEARYDALVCKAMGFLTAVVKPARHKAMFEKENILVAICEKIVIPNIALRDVDEENFEDGGVDYVRQDLEGSEFETRRKSATDLIRGFLDHFSNEITTILAGYLKNYEKDPAGSWKAKDTALYLVMALAAKSFSVQSEAGITKLNELIDPIPIFGFHVLPVLKDVSSPKIRDVIRVDALKFVTTFRAQFTKEQIFEIIPYILQHLQARNIVVACYAAVTLERLLLLKQNAVPMYVLCFYDRLNECSLSRGDVKPWAQQAFTALFELISRNGNAPEKISENDYAMRAIARLIATLSADITDFVRELLTKLTLILELISTNPSNPKFNHFIFESIALLIRNLSSSDPQLVTHFETALFPPFEAILQRDIAEYTPYVFQLFSQMLSLHQEPGIPQTYKPMLAPMLLPNVWESQGAAAIVADNQLPPVLGIFQKLIASRANDQYGFNLLEAIYDSIPMNVLAPFQKNIFFLILQRTMGSRTPKFVKSLLQFLSNLFLTERDGLSCDVVLSVFDSIELGLFAKLSRSVIIPALQENYNFGDRRLFSIGFTRLLATSNKMLEEPYLPLWPDFLNAISRLVSIAEADRAAEVLAEDKLDFEESSYQNSFVRLSSVLRKSKDRTIGIPDAKQYLMHELSRLQQSPNGGVTLSEERIKNLGVMGFWDHVRSGVSNLIQAARETFRQLSERSGSASDDVWLLGHKYPSVKDTGFLEDFASKLWMTYRHTYPPIKPSAFTADIGWGCMLRSGQMILSNAFLFHFLGRDWRRRKSMPSREWKLYVEGQV
ncbi:importin-alpha export receptor [Phlyctochytrium planicorne]|nr:importin-alpha export receptor [Phlyctochytrium planicorne]